MGRLFRVFRGDWKKNLRDHWHFLPAPGDNGWTMYVEDAENYFIVEGAIREEYLLSEETPVVITYGMPEWMVFPSGHVPPLAIATSDDLHTLLTETPWLTEVTILATIGARSVAEYNFLRRSNFTIGLTTYVVDGSQDERARATFEGLVYAERIETSERVMTEIFGEQEMQLLYRVALEMRHVDRGLGLHGVNGVGLGMNVIQIEDDDMVDAPYIGSRAPEVGGSSGGPSTLSATNGQLVPVNASQAPSVLWEVGVDLTNYPAFINASEARAEADFWREVIEEEANSRENLEVEDGIRISAVNALTAVGDTAVVEVAPSAGSAAIVCSQYGGSSSTNVRELGEVNSNPTAAEETNAGTGTKEAQLGNVAIGSIMVTISPPNVPATPPSPLPNTAFTEASASSNEGFTQASVSGDPKQGATNMKTDKPVDTSSEGSHTEGG
ncbi:Uncharacterized protein Rs2_09980 [Raphanus sativus]|nr:Uncharacterized protein Rs2_09980 [Raphanus sativus]